MSNVSTEDFCAAVAALRACLDNGSARLRFSGLADPPQLEIVHPALFEDTADARGVTDILRVVRRELPDMLHAVLTGTGVPYLRLKLRAAGLQSADNEPPSPEQAEREKTHWKERLAVVENELVTARMRQRFALRRTASQLLLRRCAGEIARQVYHTPAQGEAGHYANLDLHLEIPEREESVRAVLFSTLGVPLGNPPERRKVTLTCDETDLDVLIDLLTDLRDRLKEQVATGAAEYEPIRN